VALIRRVGVNNDRERGWVPHIHLRVVNCMWKRNCALPLVVCRQKELIIVSTGGRNELRRYVRAYHKLINRTCSKILNGTEQEFLQLGMFCSTYHSLPIFKEIF